MHMREYVVNKSLLKRDPTTSKGTSISADQSIYVLYYETNMEN